MTRSLKRFALAGLATLLSAAAFVSCSDSAPTAPGATAADAPMINKNRQAAPLVFDVTGALAGGGTFSGVVTIQRFALGEGRTLVASGVLSGTAVTAAGVTQAITDQPFTAPIEITREGDVAAAAPLTSVEPIVRPASMSGGDAPIFHTVAMQTIACDVLNLDLGPLFLNLLGLTVDLAPVVLDVRAVPGAGNLLGNLLCAIVSLLDGPGALAAILQLLGNINLLLGGATAAA
jgi:hypothetical protein